MTPFPKNSKNPRNLGMSSKNAKNAKSNRGLQLSSMPGLQCEEKNGTFAGFWGIRKLGISMLSGKIGIFEDSGGTEECRKNMKSGNNQDIRGITGDTRQFGNFKLSRKDKTFENFRGAEEFQRNLRYRKSQDM